MEARIFSITSFAFLTAWATPAKIQHVDFRATIKPLAIVIERQSPAYAALEDSRTEYTSIEDNSLTNEVAIVGRNLTTLLERRQNEIRTKLLAQAQLKPLVISNAAVTTVEDKASGKTDHLAQLIQVNSTATSTRMAQIDDNEPMTVMGLAEILVRDELARRASAKNSNIRQIETASGKEITVAKPVHIVATALPSKSNSSPGFSRQQSVPQEKAPKRRVVLPVTTTTTSRDEDQIIASNNSTTKKPSLGMSVSPSVNASASSLLGATSLRVSDKSTQHARYFIRGSITFAGGVALLSQRDEVVVLHILDGLAVSAGTVNISEARYALDVEELAGEVQVQLRSQDGQVRALGHLNLYDVAQTQPLSAKIENQEITIRPVVNGISGSVISAASFGKTVFKLGDAKLYIADLDREVLRNKKTGLFEDQDVMMPSNAILKGQMRNFWPSLAYNESGRSFYMRLFPTSMIEALFEFTLDKYAAREAANEGVIWGRVTYGGQAVEGAQVDLVGENKSKPVYFTGFMPDKTLTHTSSRGEFAFTRLSSDEKMLRVSLGTKTYWPVMVTLASGFVYYADVEAEPSRTVEFRSYDALTAQPIASLMQAMGTSEEWPIDAGGVLRTRVDTLKGLTFVESHAGDNYTPTRVMLRSGQTEVNLPHVQVKWLSEMRVSMGLSANVATANATVGFVDGEDFDVIVGAGEKWQNKTIAYFNEKGEIIKDKRKGNAKGFVVFDLPSGLNTLTIVPTQSKKIITQTVYTDQFATHVLELNLNY